MKKIAAAVLVLVMVLCTAAAAFAETDEEFWARMRTEYPEIFKAEFNWFAEMEPEPEKEEDRGPIYEYRTPEYDPDNDYTSEPIIIAVNW